MNQGFTRKPQQAWADSVGQYETMWRMAYVRGPEGIIVSLAQRID